MSPIKSGIVLLHLEPRPEATDFETWRVHAFDDIPGITNTSILSATDTGESDKPYRYQNAYLVEDVSLIDEALVSELSSAASNHISRSDWHIYETISVDKRDGISKPAPGTVVVCVGMSPIDDPEVTADYHKWYVDEHLPMLAVVPGWRMGIRGRLVSSLGNQAEICRPFLAIHHYDEENGLGGPVWRASVETPWTTKVVKTVNAPHHRRVWKFDV
jgi:hypothetical protein